MTPQRLAQISHLTTNIHPKLVNARWDFAMYPELSGKEARTSNVIAHKLRELGLEVTTGIGGGYGLVALLRGGAPGVTVALRAEMDALPIEDALHKPYKSQAKGVKHACGHDTHMVVALGVAEVLSTMRHTLRGDVKFIFQPAEETLKGARAMIAGDALHHPRPEAIFAWHNFPLPVGQIGCTPGRCLAGMEEFLITLHGPPSQMTSVRQALCAALEQLSTGQDPHNAADWARVRMAMRGGKLASNTILLSCWPQDDLATGQAQILGLVSLPTIALRAPVHAQIYETLDCVTKSEGFKYDLDFTFSNPATYNDPALVLQARPVIASLLGAEHIVTFQTPFPYSHEDFALYQQEIPGALLWLGAANPERGIEALWHTPDFDIDETALTIGTCVMAAILVNFLDTQPVSYPLWVEMS